MLGADKKCGDATRVIIIGNLCFRIRQKQRRFQLTQKLKGLCRYRIGNRQHLWGFIGRIAKHHALVTSTRIAIDPKSDVLALLADIHSHTVLFRIRKTDAGKYICDQSFVVRLIVGSDLSGNDDLIIFDHALCCHTAVSVIGQAGSNDCIRNLVTYFVGMSA